MTSPLMLAMMLFCTPNTQSVHSLSRAAITNQIKPSTECGRSFRPSSRLQLQHLPYVNEDELPSVRRIFVRNGLIVAGNLAYFGCGSAEPAVADVSDGNALPQGMAQFGRVVRAKADLDIVSKRISQAPSDMDKKEWDNVGQFLRRVYTVSDDMKGIATGLYEPNKKEKAGQLIDALKRVSKAADASTGSQSGPEFLVYAKKLDNIFEEFLELLRDVPDEL